MLKEFIQKLLDVTSKNLRIVSSEQLPKDWFYTDTGDGSPKLGRAPAGVRQISVTSIEGLADAAQFLQEHRYAPEDFEAACHVSHNLAEVRFFDREDHRAYAVVSLELEPSEAVVLLEEMRLSATPDQGMEQKDMVFHLDTTFSGSEVPSAFSSAVRMMTTKAIASSEMRHGQESMALDEEIGDGKTPLPDDVELLIPIWKMATEAEVVREKVHCAVRWHTRTRTVSLVARPDELIRAGQRASRFLSRELSALLPDSIPVLPLSSSKAH